MAPLFGTTSSLEAQKRPDPPTSPTFSFTASGAVSCEGGLTLNHGMMVNEPQTGALAYAQANAPFMRATPGCYVDSLVRESTTRRKRSRSSKARGTSPTVREGSDCLGMISAIMKYRSPCLRAG